MNTAHGLWVPDDSPSTRHKVHRSNLRGIHDDIRKLQPLDRNVVTSRPLFLEVGDDCREIANRLLDSFCCTRVDAINAVRHVLISLVK